MRAMRTSIAILALGGAATAFGFGKPENSKVEANAKLDGGNVQLTFKVLANDGHLITLDAPWKLTLKSHDGLTFTQEAFSKKDMKEELPGWVVASTAASKATGDVSWELAAFICTKDKTACYREVHEGKTNWQTAETKTK